MKHGTGTRAAAKFGAVAGLALMVTAAGMPTTWALDEPTPPTTQVLARAQSGGSGSTVVFQCGRNVCRIDPDVSGSQRVVATEAVAAGITRDGRTAGLLNRSNNVIREVALKPGGYTRQMVDIGGGSADRPVAVNISDSGTYAAWTWYFGVDLGHYVTTVKPGSSWTFPVSSMYQLNSGWSGDTLINTRRSKLNYDGTGYASRICLGPDNGTSCPNLFASDG